MVVASLKAPVPFQWLLVIGVGSGFAKEAAEGVGFGKEK